MEGQRQDSSAGMTVFFVHPSTAGQCSGGHVFNRHLLAEARRRGFPLISRPVPPSPRRAAQAIVLWDSLFLDALADIPPAAGAIHGLLAHYLPFLDPTATAAQRCRWAERYDRAVARTHFLIATGLNTARHLQQR